MRLTEIKLAGFKSFVDPTHIPVPGQLVGIVGPNGCGKSNVIDAVRWVLGESSARQLRGDTMQDVIFNGSGERQPVGRASVELIFDNSAGRAGGQWSAYADISIKRVLTRDGNSDYFINNLHVRRRDVADLFLGTGVGARAYGIIEQGMISRIIEARPEELRVFLEEAAGVSKYRERRRETELRMADTRQNLQRVEDMRQELGAQLDHLRAQAEVAKRYRDLQAQLQTAQNLLALTRKQEAAAQRTRLAREIERVGIELEAETARLREAERRVEELRSAHYAANDAVSAGQAEYFQSGAEVSRIEQHIEHLRENRSRVDQQLGAVTHQLEQAQAQQQATQAETRHWQQALEQAQHALAESRHRVEQEHERLPQAEEAYRAAQAQQAEGQRALAQAEQARGVEQTRSEHAGRALQQLTVRRQRLGEEKAGLEQPDAALLERLRGELAAVDAELQAKRAALTAREQGLPEIERGWREASAAVDDAEQRIVEIEARRDALQQLQGRLAHGGGMQGWLATHRLAEAPRVWQGIQIEPGWEDALEAVLRERLNGIDVGGIDLGQSWLGDAPPAKLTLVSAPEGASGSGGAAGAGTVASAGLQPLSAYVSCSEARLAPILNEWLHQVYVAPDAASALEQRTRLPAGALLVSAQGHVFGRYSISFHAPDSELHGVLSRQREIEQLTGEASVTQVKLGVQRTMLAAQEQELAERRGEIERLRAQIVEAQQQQHRLQLDTVRLSEQAQRVEARGGQIDAELAEIEAQAAAESRHKDAAESRLQQLRGELAELQARAQLAEQQHRAAESALNEQRRTLQQAQHDAQEAEFRERSCGAKIAELDNTGRVIGGQIDSLRGTLAALQGERGSYDDAAPQQELQAALAVRATAEQALAAARDRAQGIENSLRATERERLEAEQKLDPLRTRAGELKLKEQEARLTEQQFAQQLAEAGADEAELATQLEKGKRSGALQADITRLNGEITALGAVNLAALEELAAADERKTYLDAQSVDLTEALTTLESAIRRIDRETRELLSSTFEAVNRHFGEMFPVLFGGGEARLVLTGEEILDSGVLVVARPPGKKNTSIHLLSGGEKALTAIALVFSMFQLNPAPFCLLDEVDAPLDDANTERFCALVKKMSGQTQFLFISHNKITMEIAQQLIGVTMQELGVSRVVAVDIEEALRLREEKAA